MQFPIVSHVAYFQCLREAWADGKGVGKIETIKHFNFQWWSNGCKCAAVRTPLAQTARWPFSRPKVPPPSIGRTQPPSSWTSHSRFRFTLTYIHSILESQSSLKCREFCIILYITLHVFIRLTMSLKGCIYFSMKITGALIGNIHTWRNVSLLFKSINSCTSYTTLQKNTDYKHI